MTRTLNLATPQRQDVDPYGSKKDENKETEYINGKIYVERLPDISVWKILRLVFNGPVTLFTHFILDLFFKQKNRAIFVRLFSV